MVHGWPGPARVGAPLAAGDLLFSTLRLLFITSICSNRVYGSVCHLILFFSGKPKAWVWAHYGQGNGAILLDEVECSGNESSLDFCQKNDWGHHNCDHIEDAGVSCNPFIGKSIFGLV